MRYWVFILTPMVILFVFAIISHFVLGEEIKGARTFTDHLYFSTVTLTSVGYGDMVPQTQRAKLFVTAYIIFTYTFMVLVASTLL
jgi:voltage-gated potassium channel Kch